MTKRILALIMIWFIMNIMSLQSAFGQDKPRLLLRVDDIGMCHAVNLAMKQLAETGIPWL
ncbi:MAG: hypothetical protein ACRENG_11270 [bacterium]